MEVKDLVLINEAGIIANAVDFEMMSDREKNLELCKGFIFSYDRRPEKYRNTTVGVIDAVKEGFGSPNKPNVHLMIQDYGRGKSHFALVLANFFAKSADQPEVQGILAQIANVSGGPTSSQMEVFLAYKEQNPRHLVIPLMGEQGDVRRLLLQKLREALEAEGITDTIAQHICEAPLRFLKGLTSEQRQHAELYLQQQNHGIGAIDTLIRLLETQDYGVVSIVKELSQEVMGVGISLDFDSGLDIERIFEDLIQKLCTGEHKRFSGILILLDELNIYLQTWSYNPAAAGGTVIQNITNICERHRTRIGLICFSQLLPSEAAARPVNPNDLKDYQKLTSRLELKESTYQPISSLEHVIDRLLIQECYPTAWKEFLSYANGALRAETDAIFDNYVPLYQNLGWNREDFFRVVTYGCYPLHPMTTFFLCNLDFTQGRTAIQFIKSEARHFIDSGLKVTDFEGKPNLIHPYELVEAFSGNFTNSPIYSDYIKARQTIQASAGAYEMRVLEALFLFYACKEKLKKSDKEAHEKILSKLTGLSESKVASSLKSLRTQYGVIFENEHSRTYQFYSGFSIQDLKTIIKTEVKDLSPNVDRIVNYCRQHLEKILTSKTLPATDFIDEKRLTEENWRFVNSVCAFKEFEELTQRQERQIVETHRGAVMYVLTDTTDAARRLHEYIEEFLLGSKHNPYLIVGLPEQGVEDLPRIHLYLETLKKKPATEREKYGPAFAELEADWEKTLEKRTRELFLNSQLYYVEGNLVASAFRTDEKKLASKLLASRFPHVPPVERIDKMGRDHRTGVKIISYVCKKLLLNNLTTSFEDTSYRSVVDLIFVDSWKILKKTATAYSVQIPIHHVIRRAWDKLNEITELGSGKERIIPLRTLWETLSGPPYGYDEFTFMTLFVAWVTYHQNEILFSGKSQISRKSSDRPEMWSYRAPKDWVNTNIFDKPKDFISNWLTSPDSRLIRREPSARPNIPKQMAFSQAEGYLTDIRLFLTQPNIDLNEAEIAKSDGEDLYKSVKQFTEWSEKLSKFLENLESISFDQLLNPVYTTQNRFMVPETQNRRYRVLPSKEMHELSRSVLDKIRERIGNEIGKECAHALKLKSETELGAFEGRIQKILQQVQEHSELTTLFKEKLETALKEGREHVQQLRAQERTLDGLNQIKSVVTTLGNNPSQEQYQNALQKIREIAEKTPEIKNEDAYRQTIDAILHRQKELLEQLDQWELQLLRVTSLFEAEELKTKISREAFKFTDGECDKRVHSLIETLEAKAQTLSQQQDLVEESQKFLELFKQKSDAIAKSPEFTQAFETYCEVAAAALPASFQSMPNFNEITHTIECLKSENRQSIESRLIVLTQRTLTRIDEYERVRHDLIHAQESIASAGEFLEFVGLLKERLKYIDGRRDELQREAKDFETIREIRQLQKPLTIIDCEKALEYLDALCVKLYNPNTHKAEITQRRQSLQQPIEAARRKLNEISNKLKTTDEATLQALSRELAKLEDVVEESRDFAVFSKIQNEIETLTQDFEIIRNLARLKDRNATLVDCESGLNRLSEARQRLINAERFTSKLDDIARQLEHNRESYIENLRNNQKNLPQTAFDRAQQLRDSLMKSTLVYANSHLEADYQRLCIESELLLELARHQKNVTKLGTIAECENQHNYIMEWISSHPNLPPFLRERAEQELQSIATQVKYLRQLRHDEARKWLANLQNQFQRTESAKSEVEQVEQVQSILDTIHKKEDEYSDFLKTDSSFSQSLQQLEEQCRSIINRDYVNQIVCFFQQLPIEKQTEVFEQLERILKARQNSAHSS